jgi:hypothetical protein
LKGEKDLALKAYEQALEVWPQNEEAKKGLEELKRSVQ